MDPQTREQLVAPSNFHTEWIERVLAGVNRQFLAGRVYLAWQTTRFPNERRLLLGLFHARDRRGRDQSVSALDSTNCVSARESLARRGELRCFGIVRCASINLLRLRPLPVSVP